ncbi:DMT family transporter [Roseibium sp. RKSG952]|uniref:DMT family transporter n=1 Tax=Roseibium sp. RKSG952 TaxID=2529384 RepID=UPI0012BC1DFF|nr:DMT family transporter [Roseibium sp. RKSG952]MTH99768.1 DMT family transporter [Roseibium sp. RKSG952]
MSASATLARPGGPGLSTYDYGLYAATVFAWGFSWIAMKGQVSSVPPEVSVFWRFVLASSVMFGWSLFRGKQLRFSLSTHLRFAGLGLFLFSTNFTLFYYGAKSIPSGLLAVIFSTASIFNMILAFLLFGQRVSRQTAVAAALGFGGVAFMFWPEIAGTSFNRDAAFGLLLCIAGTLSFCMGNMVSASTQKKTISVTSATTWGMLYGTVFLGLFSWASGKSFAIETSMTYLGSLVYLAVVASVIAFASYLTLLGRIGSARAGYATVIFPVVALSVSTVFEGYVWTAGALTGLLLVMAGNVLMLRRA